MELTKQEVEEWLEAMRGDSTCRYEIVRAFPLPYGMKDKLQELCEAALKGIE
jgi:hypothetical protein